MDPDKTWHEEHADTLTFGDRIADRLAAFAGSWTFILSFLAVLLAWMAVNVAVMLRPFDPYPFILLNLVLSCVAALQAPVIMMSQKRQEARDRIQSEHNYQNNILMKTEIEALQRHLHAIENQKLDAIRADVSVMREYLDKKEI